MIASASSSVRDGAIVSGSTTMPDCAFFTRLTSRACSSIVRFLWMKPMPPSRAMRIAVAASVTVSIAELTSGIRSGIAGVRRVRDVDVARDHLAVRRDQQDVVEGERFAKLVLEHGAP